MAAHRVTDARWQNGPARGGEGSTRRTSRKRTKLRFGGTEMKLGRTWAFGWMGLARRLTDFTAQASTRCKSTSGSGDRNRTCSHCCSRCHSGTCLGACDRSSRDHSCPRKRKEPASKCHPNCPRSTRRRHRGCKRQCSRTRRRHRPDLVNNSRLVRNQHQRDSCFRSCMCSPPCPKPTHDNRTARCWGSQNR